MNDDLVDTKHGIISLKEHVVDVLERLEKLEDGHQQDGATQDNILNAHQGLLRRLEALEATVSNKMWIGAARVADAMKGDEEIKRQDRWHATRDACISAIAHGQWDYNNANTQRGDVAADLDYERIVTLASKLADRAHGPLEGKVMPQWPTERDQNAVLAKGAPPCTCRFDRSDHGWKSVTKCDLHGQTGRR